MGWLAVTGEQLNALEVFNATSPEVQVRPVRGASGGWLVGDDALPEAVEGGALAHFAEWYAALQPSDDTPAPRPKPTPRPRPPQP